MERYVVSGEVLAKYAELHTKQTAQVLEFLKLIKKEEKEESSGFSQEEIMRISEQIKDEKK